MPWGSGNKEDVAGCRIHAVGPSSYDYSGLIDLLAGDEARRAVPTIHAGVHQRCPQSTRRVRRARERCRGDSLEPLTGSELDDLGVRPLNAGGVRLALCQQHCRRPWLLVLSARRKRVGCDQAGQGHGLVEPRDPDEIVADDADCIAIEGDDALADEYRGRRSCAFGPLWCAMMRVAVNSRSQSEASVGNSTGTMLDSRFGSNR